MTELRDLVQDLRAHAHEAPAHLRDLIRRAAAELEARAELAPQASGAEPRDRPTFNAMLADAETRSAPIPPPDED